MDSIITVTSPHADSINSASTHVSAFPMLRGGFFLSAWCLFLPFAIPVCHYLDFVSVGLHFWFVICLDFKKKSSFYLSLKHIKEYFMRAQIDIYEALSVPCFIIKVH